MEFDVRTLDPTDPTTDPELLRGYLTAVNRGFHENRSGPEGERHWLADVRGNGTRLHGAWLPEGVYGSGTVPVATVVSWLGSLHTGAGLIDLHMVSDVTVSPANRRQGLARTLIERDLAEAAAAGRPIAALTVSEAPIYRRFGFGPSSFFSKVHVDAGPRFAFDYFEPTGRFVHVEPSDLGDVPAQIFDAWHAQRRGSVSRTAFFDAFVHAEWDWKGQQPETGMRAVVHLDEHDQPHGYVLYRHGGWKQDHTVTVESLVSLSPEGELALWHFLAGIDLTDTVKATVPVDHILPWALQDRRCVKRSGPFDHIWVRILDVKASLEARPWYGDGEVVLGVTDHQGHAEGRWAVRVESGRATVVRSDARPEVSLDVATLGAAYLGAVDIETLVHAGQIRGDADALALWGAMSDGGPEPYSLTSF